jgi:two-component system sensor histidine kinase PilS (NtrC family)
MPASRASFWRSLQTLNITRIVIALVLLAYVTIDARGMRASLPQLYTQTCVAYSLVALLFAGVTHYRQRHFLVQLSIQIAFDIAAVSLLYMSAGGPRSGMGILYLFPLAAAAVLAPLVLALFSASLAALLVLGDSAYRLLESDQEGSLVQAGLYGAAFMVVALVVNRLAARLIGQEELAARHGADLKSQQAINRIVIADVDDGILVVGQDGRVFTSNPAARRMMGIESAGAGFGEPGQMRLAEVRLADVRALAPVASAFAKWLRAPAGFETAFVSVKPYEDDGAAWRGRRDAPVHLKLRFARVEPVDAAPRGKGNGSPERYVIFLHDVSAIENQAQQLKLASMGRLTASIAHEVRNPLSAIGHATALLAEDLPGKAEQRLLKIVGDNVARVNRMVEDILQLSRKVQPNGQPVRLDVFLAELKSEFEETHALGADVVWIGATGNTEVRFDALHLREVVVNLLTNSTRYASKTPGSIRLFALPNGAGHMELHVQDDGPGITAEVRAHLFEPFYTTSSKGTGLGLYLARELCLNNQAMLDYDVRFDDAPAGARRASGRFVITFAAPGAPTHANSVFPATESPP